MLAASFVLRLSFDLSFPLALAGKLNRGMSVVDTVEILKGSSLSEAEHTKAAILGWCIELVRAASAQLALLAALH